MALVPPGRACEGDGGGSAARGDKSGPAGRHERILLGAGDPGTSAETVRFAFSEAEARGCTLDIVRAWRRPARDRRSLASVPGSGRRHEARGSALLDTPLRDVVLDHPQVRVRPTTVAGGSPHPTGETVGRR
ncbi:universal stress protein [Streptomyces mirabilis]|uniref:universal stress protein n=1 Tax=Streptomyces mirabilis TaxID=68239 RepID=UPI0036E373CF